MFLTTLESLKCGAKNEASDLCNAFANDEKELKIIIDSFLISREKKNPIEDHFEYIRNWLLKQECVQEVIVSKGNIRTSSPLKIIIITANIDNEIIKKTINISIERNRLKTESINNR